MPVFFATGLAIKAFNQTNAKIDGYPDWEDFKGNDRSLECFILPTHCLPDVYVIIRCLPMWKLAFPGVNLKVFQDFPKVLFFLNIRKQLSNSVIL